MELYKSNRFSIARLFVKNSDRNFNYIIWCNDTKQCAVVDPCDVPAVLKIVRDEGLSVRYVINTHAHPDHISGNDAIIKVSMISKILIHKAGLDYVSPRSSSVEEGSEINIGNLYIKVIYTPGHCTEHISLLLEDNVFVGDTVFMSGCGNTRYRGNPKELYVSITKKIMTLPDDTKIFCGHEYSINNLKFALTVDPLNKKINNKINETQKILDKGRYPLSTIGDEMDYNPFFRLKEPTIVESLKSKYNLHNTDPESVFIKLRELRNNQ